MENAVEGRKIRWNVGRPLRAGKEGGRVRYVRR